MDIIALLKEMKPEEGLVPLSIFIDREFYERELQTVFKKSWLFLGFESMVKNRGDYFKTSMGEAPVVVVRDQDENIRVFLDICPHKGMQIVRGYIGNSLFFRCPYHGWTFSADGKFVGAPYFETGYEGIINKEEWGLKEIKNVKLYKGTIWATLDEKPKRSFEEFLGDMKLYLDMLLDMFEGEIEVYGGIYRWLLQANWKIPIENFYGDGYHALTTHASAVAIGLRPPYGANFRSIYPGGGHGLQSLPGGLARRAVDIEALRPFRERLEKYAEILSQRYGSFVKNMFPFGPLNVFPNFSVHFTWNYIIFRVWHPRGPTQTLMEAGLMMFKDMPEETKRIVLRRALHEFGPGGLLEQDDAEIWGKLTSNAIYLRKHGIDLNLNYKRGLGKEAPAEELIGKGAKGIAADYYSEHNMRHFYDVWRKYLLEEEP